MANSATYVNEITLNSNVSDTPTEDNKILMWNFKNPGRAINGDFICELFNSYYTIVEKEDDDPDTQAYTTSSGTLTTAQTGLSTNFSYNRVATGFIKIFNDGVIRNIEVKEYWHNTYANTVDSVSSIYEILDDDITTYTYTFIDSSLGKVNTVSVTIEGNSDNETNVTVGSNTDGDIFIDCSFLIDASDNLDGGNAVLKIRAYDSTTTTNEIGSEYAGTSASSGTITASRTITESSVTTGNCHITVELEVGAGIG